jgi:hypothetical protein
MRIAHHSSLIAQSDGQKQAVILGKFSKNAGLVSRLEFVFLFCWFSEI